MKERHPNQRDPSTLPVELRRAPVPADTKAWVERHVGARVVGVRRLPGASSAAVHALVLAGGAKVVLRRYVWPFVLVDDPLAIRREIEALGYARGHGLRVPEVVAHDVTGAEQGDGVPLVLMSFLAGVARAVPDLDRLAEAAAAIHAVDGTDFDHDYAPWYEDTMTGPPVASERPGLWESAISVWHDAMPEYAPAFVHRDFHPGNVLWVRGRLSGVVDWSNACRGPIGCDLAHCYDNLVALADLATADRFLQAYASHTGIVFDPFWEVVSILEHSAARFTPAQLAVDEPRLDRALAALGRA